jgi:predicted phosphoadenosine phosphosulfate sulfurtransferase
MLKTLRRGIVWAVSLPVKLVTAVARLEQRRFEWEQQILREMPQKTRETLEAVQMFGPHPF